jgi:lipopolysaccharide/colanic/teichoic acid biosynthesis glycosyltransferase
VTAKRAFDLAIASLLLVAVAPLMCAIAIAVRIDSRGPSLFRQTRVGLQAREFEIMKFRTMHMHSESTGPQVTVDGDPRITRVGHYLRMSKLDELPQLLNVLRGDMSLVGPRPEVPRYVAHYPPELRDLIFSVRPGITDLTSLELVRESELLQAAENPEETYVHEILPYKARAYAHYARTRTLLGDVYVIIKTARVVVAPSLSKRHRR